MRFGLATAALVAAYAVLVRIALEPWHARGRWQPLTGFLNGLNDLLQAPGVFIAQETRLPVGYPATYPGWLWVLLANVPVYLLAGVLGRAAYSRSKAAIARGEAPANIPRGKMITRRGVLKLAGGGAAGLLGYGLLAEPRWFRVSRRELTLKGLPPELDGLRVVQLTDIHHGPWLSLAYVREVVEASNALEPDLVLLTGDYVHRSPAYVRPVVEALAGLRARIGVLGVFGNHDWKEDVGLMRRDFGKTDILLIDNGRRVLTSDRRLAAEARAGLALCGVDDLWWGRPDYGRALGGLPADMPRLLLAHNPDVAEERGLTRSGLRVDLMVSGHTHGGQVYLPFLGTPYLPSRYGQKYARGLVQGPACPVFVCRGIGTTTLPVRLGIPPEIAVLQFRVALSEDG
jgi:predicted MPP superfamily phosphohydrolase